MELQYCTCPRMSEPKVRRVKKIPTDVSVLFHKRLLIALAINVVADDGMTNRAQVNTYLVRSPGLDSHFEESETTKGFKNLVFRVCGSSTSNIRSHARTDCRMS